MSNIRDTLRQAWLPGLAAIAGSGHPGFIEWINNQEYQVYSTPTSTELVLSVQDVTPVVAAFAGDCNRFSTAAFESITGIEKQAAFPKSTSWLLIRSYYSAFFAIHALCRMWGTSFNQLERSTLDSAKVVAEAYIGHQQFPFPAAGLFSCTVDSSTKTLRLTRLNGSSHEAIWTEGAKKLGDLSRDVLGFVGTATTLQDVSELLTRICQLLTRSGQFTNSAWLSYVRNRVNYRHDFGAWFPYSGVNQNHADKLHKIVADWDRDPAQILPNTDSLVETELFVRTTATLAAVLRELIFELKDRCSVPGKRSFVCFGPIEYINRAEI